MFDYFDSTLLINIDNVYIDKFDNIFVTDFEICNICQLNNLVLFRMELLDSTSELHLFLNRFYSSEEIHSWIEAVGNKSIPRNAVGFIALDNALKGNIFASSLLCSLIVGDFEVRVKKLKEMSA